MSGFFSPYPGQVTPAARHLLQDGVPKSQTSRRRRHSQHCRRRGGRGTAEEEEEGEEEDDWDFIVAVHTLDGIMSRSLDERGNGHLATISHICLSPQLVWA